VGASVVVVVVEVVDVLVLVVVEVVVVVGASVVVVVVVEVVVVVGASVVVVVVVVVVVGLAFTHSVQSAYSRFINVTAGPSGYVSSMNQHSSLNKNDVPSKLPLVDSKISNPEGLSQGLPM